MTARVLFRGRGCRPILVAVTVVLLLGHICALPATAMSEAIGATESQAPADHHDSDGSHVASCDATLSKAAPACPQSQGAPCAVVTTVAAAVADVSGQDLAPRRVIPRRRAPDRSRFLLHASFLI
jgi:hypothetical protein